MALKRVLAVLAVLLALAGLARIVQAEVLPDTSTRASDALPLYLYGAATADGLDPTLQASLAEAYDRRGMSVGAATFSTLYPATAGALMRPVAGLDWAEFTRAWRWVLLAAVASFGLSAAWLASGDRWSRVAWGGGVAAALAWHPVSAECVRLGQVNMVLGALATAAIAASMRGPARVSGALLALGALIKLVPGALLVPLVLTRRWAALAAFAIVGVLGLAVTDVPLTRILEAVRETLRFQASIDPDWLVGRDRAPEWMRVLGFARHEGLQWVTAGAAMLVPALRPSRATAAGAMALLCAWLGADAAGFHVLYAPLAYPALAWAGVGRPARFVLLVVAFYAIGVGPPSGAEARMVLVGLCFWVLTAITLVEEAAAVAPGAIEADPAFRAGGITLLGVATGAVLAGSVPGGGPVAPPLPEGQSIPEGAGFIRPGERVPGNVSALGAGLDRPASTLARHGTIRDLQLYLRQAPVLWRGLAASYPARAALFNARASAAPAGELRDLSGRTIASWLRDEQATLETMRREGLDPGPIAPALDAALASGLTDPELRIPTEP